MYTFLNSVIQSRTGLKMLSFQELISFTYSGQLDVFTMAIVSY